MKYLDEYRAAGPARVLLAQIRQTVTQRWTIMEVCGGQTHNLMKFGIDRALPEEVELVHGPGCPVCVTPLETLDRTMAIAVRPEVIFATFGDMLRVPGSRENLFQVRSRGGDVRIVYSPLDAVNLARENPDRQVVFLAVGFETTAPTAAGAVLEADRLGLDNFSLIVSHVRVPPAIEAILGSAGNRVEAFLAAGHVCTVMGYEEYHPIAERFHVPIVVTGFEPVDLLEGIWRAVRQLEAGRAEVENQYARAVRPLGNPAARAAIETVFTVVDYPWRGIGPIPASGMALKGRYRRFDARERFPDATPPSEEPAECKSGEVLAGRLKPSECPAFGTRCNPDHPLGATMVSAEGACAAYFRYRSPQPVSSGAP
jgi:hydrogenase expression/formation protein HypD